MTENQYYYEAVGRRKEATARVRLYPAGETPEIVVNGKIVTDYFPRLMDQQALVEPSAPDGNRKSIQCFGIGQWRWHHRPGRCCTIGYRSRIDRR